MIMLIVEVLPYLAFVGAAVLIAWVGVDVLREKKSKQPPQPAGDSGRGLAGSPKPFAGQESGRLEVFDDEPEEEIVVEETPKDEKNDESPEIAVSHAVDVAETGEESDNAEEPGERAEDDAPWAGPNKDSGESDAFQVNGDAIMVRRDPSVRVFDTSVAPSSRKVPATED